MLLRFMICVPTVLLPFYLGGCTTTAPAMRMTGAPTEITGSIKSYDDLAKSFDGALSQAERKTVISGLQRDRERQSEP